MKQHITSLPHNPKRVVIISLTIAIIIGVFGYIKINQKPANLYSQFNSETTLNKNSAIYQNQNITLGFLSGGRIKSVSVKTGDKVKMGDILATLDANNVSGALIQAKAAYATAKANYEKVINGATSADITVSNSSVEIAKATLVHSKENLIIALNNSLTVATNAIHNNTNDIFENPDSQNPELITKDASFINQQLQDKVINERVLLNNMLPDWKQELSGITLDSDLANLANSSLDHLHAVAKYIEDLNSLFTLYTASINSNTKVVINNILSAQTSVTNQITLFTSAFQTVSNAEKSVEQNQALFKQKTSIARPEDVEIAEAQVNNAYGAVQIADAAYQNTVITAPSDGTVMSVSIAPGQIAIPNAPAIEFLGQILEIKSSK